MFQHTKIRFIALVLASISIEINAAGPITEENPADLYLGSCYAVQYLKLQYCPSINAIKMSSCVNNLTKVAHKNNEEDMQLGFRNRTKLIMPHIIKSIDQSFSKDLARLKGDRLRTCNVYQKDMNESMKKFLDEFKASQNDETFPQNE
jgi:hypothetical protein